MEANLAFDIKRALFAWICLKAPLSFRVILVGFVTSKFQLIFAEIPLLYKKTSCILCWQHFVLLVSKTITCSNVMTQMVICPEMKYKYVSPGSLPQFHFTTKCYLEIKVWNRGIKMRNESTTLTNIIASSWQKSHHCFDPKPHHNDKSSIWAAGQVTSQKCQPEFPTKSNRKCFDVKWVMFIKMHAPPSPLSVSGKAAELQGSMGVMHFTLHFTWETTNVIFRHSGSYTHHAVGRQFMSLTNQKTNLQNLAHNKWFRSSTLGLDRWVSLQYKY